MAGQMIQRGASRWLLRIYKGRDAQTGARIYKSITYKGGKNEARAELDRLLRRQAESFSLKPTDITVNEHFDQWFEMVASNRYTYKTFEGYKGIIAFDVRSLIGHIKLSQLQPRHIQSIFMAMRERGVCSNTRRRLYSVLSTALDCAVSWGTLEMNPMAQVEIPRREQKEMRAMSREEARQFLAVTDKGRWAEYFRTAVITGMRPGELGGLRWNEVDFENCVISVQRSLVWRGSPSEGWLLVSPKTERGRRQISIPLSLTEKLLALQKRQTELKGKVGKLYEDHGFVFARSIGQPLYYKTFIRSVFKVALERAGLPRSIRLYDLRHTCATLLLKSGEHIKVVSERLGHANISTTLETYVHVLPGMQAGAAARIESILSDSVGTLPAHQDAHLDKDEGK